MCIYIKPEDNKPIIAEENIICYKSLNHNKISEFKNYKYYRYKVNNAKIDISETFISSNPSSYIYSGNSGFHSRLDKIFNNSIFIIPKGATYYKGFENYQWIAFELRLLEPNYISNKIIYVGDIPKNNWQKFWMKLKLKQLYNIDYN